MALSVRPETMTNIRFLSALASLVLGAFAIGCANDLDDSPAEDVASKDDDVTASSNPFDPASCDGPTITFAELQQKLGPGGTRTELGEFTIQRRARSCNSVTGCGAWAEATTVGKGKATLVANAAARTFDLVVDDATNDPRCFVQLPSSQGVHGSRSFVFTDVARDRTFSPYGRLEWTSIAWSPKSNYTYGCRANTIYGLTFEGRMTKSCFRAVAKEVRPGAVVAEQVMLVRF